MVCGTKLGSPTEVRAGSPEAFLATDKAREEGRWNPPTGRPEMDDCAIDGSHVRALKGGTHTGPSPVDQAAPAASITASSTSTAQRSRCH